MTAKFMVLLFILSFFVGITTYLLLPKTTNFCKMDENQRITVCPLLRSAIKLQDATVVIYICDNNSGYIEADNKDSSIKFLAEKLTTYKDLTKIEKICENKNKLVYKIWVDK